MNTHPHQHRFYFCGQSASEAGENRHPQLVVRELAAVFGFKIIGAVPQTITCGWDFWIEMVNGGPAPLLTTFFKAASWKPVGEA